MKSFAVPAVLTYTLSSLVACRVYRPELLPSPDAAADTSAVDTVDVPPDNPPDVLTGCAAQLAMGKSCLEPLSGHGFNPDDPRVIAPFALLASGGRVFVSDSATGRVMSYSASGTAPSRVLGNGLTGTLAAGAPTSATPGFISAVSTLNGGDLVVADSRSHGLYRIRSGGGVELFINQVFSSGPDALVRVDSDRMLMVQNNQIHLLNNINTVPTPQAIVGQACGEACKGFNTTAMSGAQTQLNLPTGVSADPNGSGFYIADALNCRIRRSSLTAPYMTTVFAGNGCSGASPATLGGGMAINARVGVVGDVVAHLNGTVYFTDTTHCAIFSVPSIGPQAGQITLAAGSLATCNDATASVANVPLGRLGRLAISDDGNLVYFVDMTNQRVGALMVGVPGSPPTFPISPGISPAASEPLATFRTGRMTGLALMGDLATGSMLITAPDEGRVYRTENGTATVYFGKGASPLTPAIPADRLEPSPFHGIAVSGTTFAAATVLFGIPTHHVIARAQGNAVVAFAGQYDQPGATMGGPAMPTADLLRAPVAPAVAGTSAYFASTGTQPQLFRVDNFSSGTPSSIQLLAGAADGGTFPSTTAVPSLSATFGSPSGIAALSNGDVYIADPANNVVWKHARNGTMEIAAGLFRQATAGMSDEERSAKSVAVGEPVALAFDGVDRLFIADALANRVRVLVLSTGNMKSVAGSGAVGATESSGDNGDALAARLARPSALEWNNGSLLVGESGSGRVRVLRLP